MPVIPEIIIQKALVQGFQEIKADPRLLDVLFQNMSQQQLADLKAFVVNKPIDFSVNYPKNDALKTPAIVLILKGESEAETFIGDFAGYNDVDQDMMVDTLGGHAGSTSDLQGLGEPLIQGLGVASYDDGVVTIEPTHLDDFHDIYDELLSGKCHKIFVVSGTGAGQTALIMRTSSYSLDIQPDFSVDLDSTSVLDIRALPDVETEGEPSRVYDSSSNYERIGVHYDVQYQLQIVAGHQDEVIYLYSIIKALLLSQRPFLEGQGMMVFKISGSDFAPRGEYLPSDCFMRILNLQFTYPFTFIKELTEPSQLEICVAPNELGSPGIADPILLGPITIN